MSMSSIKPSCVDKYQAITDIIESVALEQTALSHILNAEGEKIQKALTLQTIDSCELITINNSVQKTINEISKLEMILHAKLELFSDDICQSKCKYD